MKISRLLYYLLFGVLSTIVFLGYSWVFAQEPLGPTEGSINNSAIVKGYTADSAGKHSVNNYWLIGKDGVVVIDAHWRLSEAQQAVKQIKETTNKPIRTVLITHGHTDHFGGLPVFAEAGQNVDIYASARTLRSIKNDEIGFIASRREAFGNDFPKQFPTPNRILDQDDTTFEIAGIRIEAHTFHFNEAPETTIFYIPSQQALFTGDLVNSETTPVFYQGGIDSWLDQLKQIKERFPQAKTIYPGHGKPGSAQEMIDAEITYLSTFRDLVSQALLDDSAVSNEERERIKAIVNERFPTWRTAAGIPERNQLLDQNINWTLRGWRVRGTAESNPRDFRQN